MWNDSLCFPFDFIQLHEIKLRKQMKRMEVRLAQLHVLLNGVGADWWVSWLWAGEPAKATSPERRPAHPTSHPSIINQFSYPLIMNETKERGWVVCCFVARFFLCGALGWGPAPLTHKEWNKQQTNGRRPTHPCSLFLCFINFINYAKEEADGMVRLKLKRYYNSTVVDQWIIKLP